MNEDKELKRKDLMENDAYELLFGDRMKRTIHKKKKRKIINPENNTINKKEEKLPIKPLTLQNEINTKIITKSENKNNYNIINEKINKIKNNNSFQKEHQFIGNKRINEDHKIEYKEKEDKNKIIKTKVEKYQSNNFVKKIIMNIKIIK